MLVNLRDDISEQGDLAASHPAKLKEVQAAFAEWEKGIQPGKWIRQDARNGEVGGKRRRLRAARQRLAAAWTRHSRPRTRTATASSLAP
jgi:hypothetical protein